MEPAVATIEKDELIYKGVGHKFTLMIKKDNNTPAVPFEFIQYGSRETCLRNTVKQIREQMKSVGQISLSMSSIRSEYTGEIKVVQVGKKIRMVFQHALEEDNFSVSCPCTSIDAAERYAARYKNMQPYSVAEFKFRYKNPHHGFENLKDVLVLFN